MPRLLIFIVFIFGLIFQSDAATVQSNATQTSAYNYNYMYPFMNNQMRTDLNPGTSTQLNSNPINSVVVTKPLNTARRVVARTATNTGATSGASTVRNTTTTTAQRRVIARSAASPKATSTTRRVVARTTRQDASYTGESRGDASYIERAGTNSTASTNVTVSSSRCLADYIDCMNGYCERADTAYNRCYCSARLSQIDATYQDTISDLINQIVVLRGTGISWSSEEMDDWWMERVGKYSGDTNSWTNLDNALNIDWSSTESRVRGQQAFATGHEYCTQHLRNCYYMSSNMRDAYRSEISRDCDTYEKNLQTIKSVAETLIEAYK